MLLPWLLVGCAFIGSDEHDERLEDVQTNEGDADTDADSDADTDADADTDSDADADLDLVLSHVDPDVISACDVGVPLTVAASIDDAFVGETLDVQWRFDDASFVASDPVTPSAADFDVSLTVDGPGALSGCASGLCAHVLEVGLSTADTEDVATIEPVSVVFESAPTLTEAWVDVQGTRTEPGSVVPDANPKDSLHVDAAKAVLIGLDDAHVAAGYAASYTLSVLACPVGAGASSTDCVASPEDGSIDTTGVSGDVTFGVHTTVWGDLGCAEPDGLELHVQIEGHPCGTATVPLDDVLRFVRDDCDGDTVTVAGGDCDDDDDALHPTATEVCDGIDNDCDTDIDDADFDVDVTTGDTFWADSDEDGFGDPDVQIMACQQPALYADNDEDCNDDDDTIKPGVSETCDGVDEDCNTLIDDSPIDPLTFYTDDDGDGFGNDADGGTALGCTPPTGFGFAGDCDDSRRLVYPGAPEVCDGVTNDCDGLAMLEAGLVSIGGTNYDDLAAAIQASVPDDVVNICSGDHGGAVVPHALSIVGIAGSGATTMSVSNAGRVIDALDSLTLSGVTVTGGNAADGAGIRSAPGHVLTLSDVVVSGNVATGNGGGILAETLEVAEVTIANNSAVRGGGISAASVTGTDLVVDGNTALLDGGGIAAMVVDLESAAITGNDAGANGGGIHAGELFVVDATIQLNDAGGNGGGVHLGVDPTATLVAALYASTVDQNTAVGDGGGVWADTDLDLAGTTISANTAELGAGVWVDGTLLDGTVVGNTATLDGGGVYGFDTSGSTNTTLDSNHAGRDGGGMYCDCTGDLVFTNATVVDNTSDGFAAGVLTWGDHTGSLTITLGSYQRNQGIGAAFTAVYPGPTTVDNALFADNTSTGDGGGLHWNDDQAALTVTGATFSGNQAWGGVGIDITGAASVSVGNSTFLDNVGTQTNGGALDVDNAGDVVITDSTFINNDTAADGGAIHYAGSSLLSVTATTITGSDADYGAGIDLDGGVLEMSGGSVASSNARIDGGGVHIGVDGSHQILGGLIQGNSAVEGGGIFLTGDLELTGTTVETNNAANFGAGIHAASGASVLGGVVRGNVADSSGGGIHCNDTITITGTRIENNETGHHGGGLHCHADAGWLQVDSVVLQGNTAPTLDGGAAFLSGLVDIVDTDVIDNTCAQAGGGIAIDNPNARITRGSFVDNIGPVQGGGLFVKGSSGVTQVTNTVFRGNESNLGGGIRTHTGALTITQAVFEENEGYLNFGGGGVQVGNGNGSISSIQSSFGDPGPLDNINGDAATPGNQKYFYPSAPTDFCCDETGCTDGAPCP